MHSYSLKGLIRYAKKLRIFLLDLLFPKECLGCLKEGTYLCDVCYNDIQLNTVQSCPVCNKNNFLGSFCKNCSTEASLSGILVASDYKNKLLSKVIKSYKYKFVRELKDPLGSLLIDFSRNLIETRKNNYFWHSSEKRLINDFQNVLIIPVPLHKKRLRWRGFNQSEDLANIFSSKLKLEINTNQLKRHKFKKPQTSLGREERFKNIKNSFTWDGKPLENKNIILIDDVSTSTATLCECSKVLKANGAKQILGLVLAHG
ncbi:hypothetical protein C0584_01495 [Candidatus Parcubacteria bacterium]|nr:MAG: hypothetical protein C0584_01495 [Candidatus Parcubacteria bacterium]